MSSQLAAERGFREVLESLIDGGAEYYQSLGVRFAQIEPDLRAFLAEPGRIQRLVREYEQLAQRYSDPEQRPPLFGLPVAVKDIFHVDGFETRAGSRLPSEALAGEEAESVRRLKAAGALVLGKTVTTEFAYFAPGPTTNPHNPDHTPGGSSSGSAAAVAAGLAPLALGTQTIGSVNRPAAFCGVVGFKPTFGRIPTAGVIPLSLSLDHVGYFTASAARAAEIAPVLLSEWTGLGPGGHPALGVPTGPYLDRVSDEGRESFERTLGRLRDAGIQIAELPAMSDYEQIAERHRLILAAEAAQVHQQWFAEFADRYDPKTAELIRAGQSVSAEDLETAGAGRGLLRDQLNTMMSEHEIDLWISPSATGTAPRGLGSTGDPAMNLPWTHAGLPTITLTSDWSSDELPLPLGIQLTARWGEDEQLLAYAQVVDPLLGAGSVGGTNG